VCVYFKEKLEIKNAKASLTHSFPKIIYYLGFYLSKKTWDLAKKDHLNEDNLEEF
jgi:hypothetical protein